VLASYGHYVIERLRERVALPGDKGLIALAEAVAVRTGRSPGEVMRLLMEAREDAPSPPGGEEIESHLRSVRELSELLSWGAEGPEKKRGGTEAGNADPETHK